MNTMNEAVEAVEVTQADRDRAADFMEQAGYCVDTNWFRKSDCVAPLVRAFARHRIASVAAARAALERPQP